MKIYRGTDGDTSPVEMECEEFGYPNKTTCGEKMFENTHFRTKAEAWDSILRSVAAGVKLSGARVIRSRAELAQAQQWAGDMAALFEQAHEAYDAWVYEQKAAKS